MLILQEIFEVQFAKMPEEPPKETSDSSDEDDDDDDDDDDDESASEGGDESSSGEDSESEAKRATQLSYLHKQVRERGGGCWIQEGHVARLFAQAM